MFSLSSIICQGSETFEFLLGLIGSPTKYSIIAKDLDLDRRLGITELGDFGAYRGSIWQVRRYLALSISVLRPIESVEVRLRVRTSTKAKRASHGQNSDH